jgi:hypothetical protein
MKKTIALITCLLSLATAKAELVINSTVPEAVVARTPFAVTASVLDTQYGTRRFSVMVLVRRNGEPYKSYRFVTDQFGNGGVNVPGLPCSGQTEEYTVSVLVNQSIRNDYTVTAVNKGLAKWLN